MVYKVNQTVKGVFDEGRASKTVDLVLVINMSLMVSTEPRIDGWTEP